jgi:uncharacterized protein YcbX
MPGTVAALYRHPVKGFTPEPVAAAALKAHQGFPEDRLYAVENGPSGFDPDAPAFISKTRFTVLAQIPELARIKTRYDDGVFTAEADGRGTAICDLRSDAGRSALAAWLETAIGPGHLRGPLKVVHAPGHRFMDHPKGAVSIVNLASVAALGRKLGKPLDPLRFRANVYVADWPAWAETEFSPGLRLRLGGAQVVLFKPIVRCVATHVDPATGVRDIEVVDALRTLEGHLHCGLYVHVVDGGVVSVGDAVEVVSAGDIDESGADQGAMTGTLLEGTPA